MATPRDKLKSYFAKYKKPTESQYAEMIDAFLHKYDDAITIGGNVIDGKILLKNAHKIPSVEINGGPMPVVQLNSTKEKLTAKLEASSMPIGSFLWKEEGSGGSLLLCDNDGIPTAQLHGKKGELKLGRLKPVDNSPLFQYFQNRIRLNGENAKIELFSSENYVLEGERLPEINIDAESKKISIGEYDEYKISGRQRFSLCKNS